MYTTSKKFYLGTGRRKTSVARVRLCEMRASRARI